ncbi:hypothetical protein [Stenotrophomonas panacihumi]|nr:hypothetical protein [Stenotrophomonas panacihumi]
MKRSARWAVLGLLAWTGMAQADGWVNREGEAVPETESQATVKDFSAMLLLTPDRDWQEKWNTPADHAPHFNTAKEVGPGGELNVLILLANPQVDPKTGMTDVACDLEMHRPNGEGPLVQKDVPCFNVKLTTDPRNVYMTNTWMKYIEEPADPRGTWTVIVRVRDRLRDAEVPLRASFVVKGKMTRSRPSAADASQR